MSLSIVDFWKLARQSKLLASEQCQQYHGEFARNPANGAASGQALAEWLVAQNVISRYQAKVLLAGQPGPFEYGDYRVYDRVETGRLAGYYRAVHAATAHPVLLQFQAGSVAQDPGAWGALVQEVKAAEGMSSPYLQEWYEAADLGNFKFLVSEDLRGSSLDERLAAGRLSPQEAARLGMMSALALVQMHATGRLHGDLRPANLWLEPLPNHPGHLKLLRDASGAAGLQTVHPGDPNLAQRADYLAPEFLQPGKVPDVLTDLYALGCTLYQLLAGTPPFAGGVAEQKLARHAQEPIRPLEHFGVPQPLAQLVTYLMAKNPAVRYQQAAVVAEQLAPFVDQAALYLPTPAPLPTLPAYSAAIKAKQQPAAIPTGVAAPVGTPVGSIPAGIAVGKVVVPAGTAAGAASVTGPVVSLGSSNKSSVKPAPKPPRDKTTQLAITLGAVGVIAVIGLIVVNNMGSGTKPEVVKNNPIETDPGDTDVEPTDIEKPAKSNSNLTKTSNTTPDTPKPKPEHPTAEGPKTPPAETGPALEVIPDDGQLLWASPTSGKPVNLRGVPPEGQLYVILRPAVMLASAEGKRVLDALGPGVEAARKSLEDAAGFKFGDIDQLIVTFHNNDSKFPHVSCVVHPKERLTADELLAKFGGPAMQEEAGQKIYVKDGWAYYIFGEGEERAFTMSDVETTKLAAELKGAAPALRPAVERVRRTTDDARHVTLLVYPNFLENSDGEPLFQAERAKIKEPLLWLLGTDLQAAAASLHFSDQFYLETRLVANLNKEKFQLAKELRERVQKIPNQILDYFVTLNPPLYWKKVSMKYPDMIEELAKNSRTGVEDDQAVLNCVLPLAAAHNLVLGTELAISSAPGAASTAVATPSSGGVKTIEDLLKKKASLSFDRDSLERSMAAFAADLKADLPDFDIVLLGKDLQLDGITKNQSFGIKQEDKPVAEILTTMVMKANPVTTVKDPSEADQKLVWMVGPNPDNPKQRVVLITTRAAAGKRGDKLPGVFSGK